MAERDKCTRGYGCGLTCINKEYSCSGGLNKETAAAAERLATLIGQLGETRSRAAGVGSATLSRAEVEALATRKRVPVGQGFRKVSDAEVEEAWGKLTAAQQKRVIKKGSLGADYKDSYLVPGPTPAQDSRGAAGVPRAKFLLRRWLEQDGKDFYTGLPISWAGADLEHIEPLSKLGAAAETRDNMVFVSSAVNQRKGDKSYEQFIESEVTPKASWSDARWAAEDARLDSARKDAQAKLAGVADLKPEDVTPEVVSKLGKKWYHASRQIGLPVYYTAGSKGRSGAHFPSNLGKPILDAYFADRSLLPKLVALSSEIASMKSAETRKELPKGASLEYLSLRLEELRSSTQ